MARRICVLCREVKPKPMFTGSQWKKKESRCKTCSPSVEAPGTALGDDVIPPTPPEVATSIPFDPWNVSEARNLWGIRHWGAGYFDIGESGHVEVRPRGPAQTQPPIDLYKLVCDLREDPSVHVTLPLLLRFPDILQNRVHRLCGAFNTVIERLEYRNKYTAIYPIKVNQQEAVVKSIIATHGDDVSVGLEAGSKPELMAVLALAPTGGTIVCNGYKDREFIRYALIGVKLGHRVFIVIEKESEVATVIRESQRLNVTPTVGIRVRLSSLESSKWADTGGPKAKFGLNSAQVMSVVAKFRAAGMEKCVQLLHFHMGSQIANISHYRAGLREAVRYFGELRALGLPIENIDVGGGLGVDYDGTHSRSSSSINYDVEEYAMAIVSTVKAFCNESDLPHPRLLSESGRALAAYHAVLVVNVTDMERQSDDIPCVDAAEIDTLPEPLQRLYGLLEFAVGVEFATETYHRATQYSRDVAQLYAEGKLGLKDKALADNCYSALCRRLLKQLTAAHRSHRQVYDELNERLADKYFCNFSVFQSLPDTWAINQVLPIQPLHRLDERPTRRAVLEDLTCDSDGKVKFYVESQSVESNLSVHELRENEEYLLAVFLVGAYQEILGDMHNLFGDTDSVNVHLEDDGTVRRSGVEAHDTVEDMLKYVHLAPEEIVSGYRKKLDAATLTEDERYAYVGELMTGLTRSSYLSTHCYTTS